MTAPPAWLTDAVAMCPAEAAHVDRLAAALQALPANAPMSTFVALYEDMLAARDVLYEAWISQEMDA